MHKEWGGDRRWLVPRRSRWLKVLLLLLVASSALAWAASERAEMRAEPGTHVLVLQIQQTIAEGVDDMRDHVTAGGSTVSHILHAADGE